jgi:photosynthetic reaction center cytochrome c subunit
MVYVNILFVSLLHAADKPVLPAISSPHEKAESITGFTNITLLRHLNPAELQRLMGFFAESLGVKCFFCHDPKDYSLDEISRKIRAREMLSMVQEVNKRFFYNDRITCYTCHRGSPIPIQVPENWTTQTGE